MRAQRQRVDRQAAFLLHAYPYSETSLIVEAFSREHGRLALMARGARRPRSLLRGVLMAFQPLELGWFGGGEVKTLAKAEWSGGLPMLRGEGLLLGYYINELILKLLPREDAHAQLFSAYAEALRALALAGDPTRELRRFEKILLAELGYGLTLEQDIHGDPITASVRYHYQIEKGPVPGDDSHGLSLDGKTLLDLAADNYDDPQTMVEAKLLMRHLLAHYLNGQALQTRRVFIDLQAI